MKFKVTIILTVEADNAIEAFGFGQDAADHLYETFNDDESIDEVVEIYAEPKPETKEQECL
jgi:hypothetical protein